MYFVGPGILSSLVVLTRSAETEPLSYFISLRVKNSFMCPFAHTHSICFEPSRWFSDPVKTPGGCGCTFSPEQEEEKKKKHPDPASVCSRSVA